VDPGGLPWLLFPVQPRRLLIGHEAHSQVNSNGGGNHRGSRRSPLAAVLGPAKEAGKEGIKPEGESEDSSSIPASLYLPCDVKHALLTMPRGHRSSDLGQKANAHLSAPRGCVHRRGPVGKRDHHLSTTTPSMRESQGASEAGEAVPAVGELLGQKH
jgi:hypothetical protein